MAADLFGQGRPKIVVVIDDEDLSGMGHVASFRSAAVRRASGVPPRRGSSRGVTLRKDAGSCKRRNVRERRTDPAPLAMRDHDARPGLARQGGS